MSRYQLLFTVTLLFFLKLALVSGTLSDDHEETPIIYQLFTRKNPSEFQKLLLNDVDALNQSNFNPKALIKFYAPGWDNNGSIAYSTKDEYLLREDCNIIVIDWSAIQPPNYTELVVTTTIAGLHAGAFINFLIDNGAHRSLFHAIGHSAGTHLAGVAAAAVTSGKIPRITGLDPGRTWPLNETDIILDKTDADFVDIVHTNGGDDEYHLAIFDPIGHVDFYANGGQDQPGCDDQYCSHLRTTRLFTESINSNVGFRSLRCDTFEDFQEGLCDGNDTELMGDVTPSSTRGVFHFTTNAESPFARG